MRPEGGKTEVWGDYFQSDTRMILAVLDYCGDTNYEFHSVNSLESKEEEEEYLKINPTGKIPTLKEKKYIMLGSGDTTILTYLCKAHHQCACLFPKDKSAAINRFIQFFNMKMRPTTQKLIRQCKTKIMAKNGMSEQLEEAIDTSRMELM